MTCRGHPRAGKARRPIRRQLILGAGTVLDPETARACMLAGAEFFVTPSGALTPPKCSRCGRRRRRGQDLSLRQRGRPVYQGAERPLPQIEMIPTEASISKPPATFSRPGLRGAVGGELVDAKTVKEGRFDIIENRPASTWRPSPKRGGNARMKAC